LFFAIITTASDFLNVIFPKATGKRLKKPISDTKPAASFLRDGWYAAGGLFLRYGVRELAPEYFPASWLTP